MGYFPSIGRFAGAERAVSEPWYFFVPVVLVVLVVLVVVFLGFFK